MRAQVLEDPHSLAFPPAQLRDLQGGLLRATAALRHSRALHAVDGLLTEDPPAPSGRHFRPPSLPGSQTGPPGMSSQQAATPLSSTSAMRAVRLGGSMLGPRDTSGAVEGDPAGAVAGTIAEDESFVSTMERRLRRRTRTSLEPNGAGTGSSPRQRSFSPLSSPETAAASPASAGGVEHGGGGRLVLQSGAGGRQEREMLLRGVTREVDRLLGSPRQRHVSPSQENALLMETPGLVRTVSPALPALAVAASPKTAAGSGGIGRGSLKQRASQVAKVGAAQVHCNPLYTKQEEAAGGGGQVVKAGGRRTGVPGSTECIDAIAEQIAAKLLTKLQARYEA